MSKEEQIDLGKTLIAQMREFFARGDLDRAKDVCNQIARIEADRPARLEPTCLGARTLIVTRDQTTARKVKCRAETATGPSAANRKTDRVAGPPHLRAPSARWPGASAASAPTWF